VYYYDHTFDPPAPVLILQVSSPLIWAPVATKVLLDSGADITVLPQTIVSQLQLRQVDLLQVYDFDGIPLERPAYSALVKIETSQPQIIRVISGKWDYGLVGRDMLNQWKVVLDGPKGSFEIS
jgi:predicted aspartyl protease